MEKNVAIEGKMVRKNLLFTVVFVLSFLYILWRLLFTLPLNYGVLSIVVGVLLWFCESITTVETFVHFRLAHKYKEPEMPVIPDDMYPELDVMICTHNEDEDILIKTINGCKYMKYPDKAKIHIYLCDDGARDKIHALAERMAVNYIGFSENKHAKAGNLNHAMKETDSPYIVVFDADMIPTPEFLLETIPYFYMREMIKEDGQWRRREPSEIDKNEKPLGYVQTRQSFYNPDVYQRNLYLEDYTPNEQDYFYRSVNVVRTSNSSSAFAGSNTVMSRQAIVDAGGFATHSITEDLATSIEILGKGYSSMAVDKELAHGLSADDVKNHLKQRKRWSRGAAQCIPTMRFFKSRIPLRAKISLFVSYLYWWTFFRRLVFVACPILVGLFGIHVADTPLRNLLLIWLPYYLIYNAGLRLMSGGTTNSIWSNMLDTIMFPYMIWPVFAGTIKIPQKKFWVTPKEKQLGRNSSLKYAIPHVILIVMSVLAIVRSLTILIFSHQEGYVIVLFWLCYNLFGLFAAIIFYYGRKLKNRYEDIPVSLPVIIESDGEEMSVVAACMSEEEIILETEHPELLLLMDNMVLRATYKNYSTKMRVTFKELIGKNRCTLYIKDIEESDKLEYLQILYDRNHPFSETVKLDVVDFIRIVFGGLLKTIRGNIRQLHRATEVTLELQTIEGDNVSIASRDGIPVIINSAHREDELVVVFPNEKYYIFQKSADEGDVYKFKAEKESIDILLNYV